MPRYIDIEIAIKIFKNYERDCRNENDENSSKVFADVITELEDIKPVNLVPAPVKCGECKNGWTNGGRSKGGAWIPTIRCNKHNCNMEFDDFCSHGERKEDSHE